MNMEAPKQSIFGLQVRVIPACVQFKCMHSVCGTCSLNLCALSLLNSLLHQLHDIQTDLVSKCSDAHQLPQHELLPILIKRLPVH